MIDIPYNLIAPDEAVRLGKKAMTLGHMEVAYRIANAWISYRSTQEGYLKCRKVETKLLLGCVFLAGTIFGARLLRYRKKQKKALRG